ncbi:DsbE family thiol:disulfide interchange protein, partial [Salmonella enterica subsp. enterica serovar Typhimurium]|nr:DsbE family thiol:disulfide interchange protein [Salmonella enterica subsp. enterica serovar Typhimurium]
MGQIQPGGGAMRLLPGMVMLMLVLVIAGSA